MSTLDWIVLGLFCVGLIGIVIWVILKKDKDTTDYFLAGRDATWIAIGASIFASNIGSEHLVGLAGAGAESGMAMAGLAAFINEGRFPFFVLACKVNWLTTIISPFTSIIDKFINPFSSPFAIHSRMAHSSSLSIHSGWLLVSTGIRLSRFDATLRRLALVFKQIE